MNKKAVNIILIVIVCGIWSVVIYRFFSNQTGSEFVGGGDYSENVSAEFTYKREDFTLSNINRDPFLDETSYKKGGNTSYSTQVTSSANTTTSQKNTPIKIDPLPENNINLRFQGIVKNNTTNATLALIAFNGKSVRMSQGQIHEGYKLEKIYRDSALLSRNKERIIARK